MKIVIKPFDERLRDRLRFYGFKPRKIGDSLVLKDIEESNVENIRRITEKYNRYFEIIGKIGKETKMNTNEMQEILDSYSSMEWEPFSDDGQAYIDAESYGLEFDEGFGIWVNSKGRADVVYGLDGVSYSHDTNDLHIKDAINMAEDLTEGLLQSRMN